MRSRCAAGLLSGLVLIAGAGSAAADEPLWDRLDAALRAVDAAATPATDAARGRPSSLVTLRDALERRAARQRAAFDNAAARDLPAKSRERLQAARTAFERGQGRVLEILRTLDAADSRRDQAEASALAREALAREARALVAQVQAAQRQEPLSSELKLRAPQITPGPLPTGTQANSTGAPPDAATPIGPIPPVLRQVAEALDGPVAVYEWVRGHVRPEFYRGALKGPLQTYLEGSGNDADTAALLVTLLRAQGIPARFLRGSVSLSARQLQDVVGTASVEQALRVLERAGIPHEAVTGAGGVVSVKLERVWAEAYVAYANYRGTLGDAQGKLWVPLDAGFKRLEPPSGIDAFERLALDPRALADEYLQAPRAETPREFVRQRVGALLGAQGLSYEAALNRREPVAERLGILPSTLPYEVLSEDEPGYEISDELQHTLRIVGETQGQVILDASLRLADVLGQRLTLAYVPFDADDERTVALYHGLARTPPYLIEVRPLLRLGGVALTAGTGPVGAGVRYDLRVELRSPGGLEVISNRVLGGNLTAIGLGGRRAAGSESQSTNAGALLARIAFEYLRRWSDSDDELSRLARVVPVRPTASLCFVMSDVQVEYAAGDPLYPLTFDWKGVALDADLRASAPVGVEGRAQEPRFTLLSGLEGSLLESRVFEDAWGIAGVSTAKALQLAAQQGVEIVTLTRDNVEAELPGLPLDEGVKDEIRDATGRGFVVRVPARALDYLAWSGVGYRILDEETGEAAYQLQGGHSGGVTASAVVDWPDHALVETLADQGEAPAPSGTPVAHIVKFISTDYQKGTVNQPLERPLRVLLLDQDGQRIPDGP